MARMRDALKVAEVAPKRVAPPGPALQAVWPEDPGEAFEDAEDVPYIEIGGPKARTDTTNTVPFPGLAARTLMKASAEPKVSRDPVLWSVRFRELPVDWPAPCVEHDLAAELVCWHQPQHPISEQYRGLVASLQANAPRERPRVYLFTAAVPSAGTTTVLLNSAVTLAQMGKRVLVLDAHLREPAVAERLGIAPLPGLREVLGGVVALERAIRTTGVPNLLALTAGLPVSSPSARLAGEAMQSLVRQVREQFDMVLIDAPHWDGRPEVVALGCACDAVYLCLPEKAQDSAETQELLQLIPEQGAPLGGCIVTAAQA